MQNQSIFERPTVATIDDRIGFVVASTHQGTFILNRFDYLEWRQEGDQIRVDGGPNIAGVAAYLLSRGRYDEEEAQSICGFLGLRRKHHGDGVVALDVGANIGVFTVVWARHMTGWGHVVAVEPQARIYYALCGNIAINNCWNAQAIHAAISDGYGWFEFAEPDYRRQGAFGAFELKTSYVPGQEADPGRLARVESIPIDQMGLPRLDFLKIDIEGMECEALRGAAETIRKYKPVISIEVMRDDNREIEPLLREFGYTPPSCPERARRQLIVWHPDDPISADLVNARA